MKELCKRSIDVAGAAIGLVLAAPILVAASVAIRLSMGRPVLFRQWRAGKNGQAFRLYKLRTMTSATDQCGQPRPDRERLTPLGRWMRGSSIDELPQLWNVLKGDMSLVGPRALLAEYVPRYNAFQRRRLEVKPGITGWAQIHGRNGISWEEKFARDVWYVDHRSLRLDLLILARTARVVLRRTGVEFQDGTPMPGFMDSGAGDR